MMKKYCFNMIEIILAISIIAIGISSVMALFISGIKTGNDTVISSNMPDMTESMLSFIRGKIADCRSANGWDTGKLAKVAPDTAPAGAGDLGAYIAESGDGTAIKGDDNGRFLYRQLSVSEYDASGKPSKYLPTFSALATVKRIKDADRFKDFVLSNPDDIKGAEFDKKSELKDSKGKSGVDLLDKFRVVAQVTISYPADAPKESKTYIIECFNDKYDRFTREGESE